MNSKHLDGLAVVSLDAGEKLGRVAELLLDPEGRRIAAFAVQSADHTLVPTQPASTTWLAPEDVHAIGPDALTVRNASVLHDSLPEGPVIRFGDLLKRKVITEDGTSVGPVASIDVDERGTAVTAIEVSSGFFKANRTIPAAQIVNVGPEFVVVSDAVCRDESEREAQAQAEHPHVVGDVEPLSTNS